MSRSVSNLFATLAADGSTAALVLGGPVNTVNVFLKEGASDGGGTLIMQVSFDGGTTWTTVPSASWTSGDGILGQYTVYGQHIRFTLSGATSPTNFVIQVSAVALSPESQSSGNFVADGTTLFLFGRAPAAGALYGDGTWGSGTLKLEFSTDGGTTWYDTGASLTADGSAAFTNVAGATVFRAALSGATSPVLVWDVTAK
jgi:hypothetical protein